MCPPVDACSSQAAAGGQTKASFQPMQCTSFAVRQVLLGRGAVLPSGAAEEAPPLRDGKRPRSRRRDGRPELQNLQDRRSNRLVWGQNWRPELTDNFTSFF